MWLFKFFISLIVKYATSPHYSIVFYFTKNSNLDNFGNTPIKYWITWSFCHISFLTLSESNISPSILKTKILYRILIYYYWSSICYATFQSSNKKCFTKLSAYVWLLCLKQNKSKLFLVSTQSYEFLKNKRVENFNRNFVRSKQSFQLFICDLWQFKCFGMKLKT